MHETRVRKLVYGPRGLKLIFQAVVYFSHLINVMVGNYDEFGSTLMCLFHLKLLPFFKIDLTSTLVIEKLF